MLRERFKPSAIFAAIQAAFLGQHLQQLNFESPDAPSHDAYHHQRCRVPTAGEIHRARMKAKRRARNEMAFESRRRNRA